MVINYRKAVLQDEEGLFILAASFTTSFKIGKRDFLRVFLEILSDNNADIIIAEKGLEIIGYVLAFHHPTFYASYGDI